MLLSGFMNWIDIKESENLLKDVRDRSNPFQKKPFFSPQKPFAYRKVCQEGTSHFGSGLMG